MFLIDVIYNLTVLVAISVLSGFVDARAPRNTLKGKVYQGLLIGTAAVVGMMQPFVLYSGVIFDGRTVVLSVGTLFFGPVSGLISATMATIMRIGIGGDGLLTGILAITSAVAIGTYFHYRLHSKNTTPSVFLLYVMGLIVHVVLIAIMFTLPETARQQFMEQVAVTVITFFPLATVLMGKVLSDQLTTRILERDLDRSDQKFRVIFNSTNEAIFIHDAKTFRIIDINDRTLQLYGVDSREEILDPKLRNIYVKNDVFNDEKARDYLKKCVEEGPQTFDWLARKKSGEPFWVEISLNHVDIGDDLFIIAVARDINDRKHQEQETIRNLREKEILLSEVHHRVKNNLAIISGLLTLRSEGVKDRYAREILSETENRIKSIALVHELLYENNDMNSIDFGKFLGELSKLFHFEPTENGTTINITTTTDKINLNLNKSIPCALIVTELVINSYKHAFAGRHSGSIHISIEHSGDQYELNVRDNGIGIKDIDNVMNLNTFGFTIIRGLVEQLDGKLIVENTDPGCSISVTFSANI